ncbi:TrkH family potassium uptake protein [Nitrosomonas marina]|uniref:Trk system potassium uptake protein TrkH n=1 Tax=Nitrosomonas marina TaxID=917 RepID=A0A1H8B8A3_9PROT|nr:TrkH family potassium uptake protein [Nitrosomonas marina]SEM79201.1 trk system potassium uptake protein TrkH [Nitrosomonas marina]
MYHYDNTTLLQKSVRFPVIGKYLGQLLVILAALSIVPLAFSLLFMEYDFTVRFMIVEAILLATGLPLMRINASANIQTNEGLVVTGFIFILSPLVMTIPMMGNGMNFINALFESVSAFTTTGLSVATELQQQPLTFLFARAYMQWIGGLGIVVLTIALLLKPGAYLRKLIELDEKDDIVSSTRTYARRIMAVYILLTVIGTCIIWIATGDLFNAVTHAFTAVSTGGFSNYDNSLAGLQSSIAMVSVISGCFLGALPLLLYFRLHQTGLSALFHDTQVRAMVFFVACITILLTLIFLYEIRIPFSDALFHALLITISAQTTAGFTSIEITHIGLHGMLVIMVAMVIGGALGSTAGGVKLFRILIFWRALQHMLRKTAAIPHAVIKPSLGSKNLETDEINKALLVILLFIITVFFAWLVFLYSGHQPLAALFEVVSATATVGLSSGITDSELSSYLKLVLCACMLLGRLEFIALLILVYPSTWTIRRTNA